MTSWAGSGYPDDDRYTALWDELLRAWGDIVDFGTSQYCAGLIQAYSIVTGDTYENVVNQVAKAARETVASV